MDKKYKYGLVFGFLSLFFAVIVAGIIFSPVQQVQIQKQTKIADLSKPVISKTNHINLQEQNDTTKKPATKQIIEKPKIECDFFPEKIEKTWMRIGAFNSDTNRGGARYYYYFWIPATFKNPFDYSTNLNINIESIEDRSFKVDFPITLKPHETLKTKLKYYIRGGNWVDSKITAKSEDQLSELCNVSRIHYNGI